MPPAPSLGPDATDVGRVFEYAVIGAKYTLAELMFYAGIMHSKPMYRMHPSVSERELVELWRTAGRALPLVDGGPAKAPPPRKAMIDPSIITATRPTDVAREVIHAWPASS